MRYRPSIALIYGLIGLGLLGAKQIARAQEQNLSYQAISDNFFKMLQQGKGSEAVDYMFATNPSVKRASADHVDQLKAQFASLNTLMGSYISHSKLVETKVAGMFVYQHYFVAFDRQPISVRIKYYKPADSWLVYGLQFDGELTDNIQKEADNNLLLQAK